jgi:hypothetical protein
MGRGLLALDADLYKSEAQGSWDALVDDCGLDQDTVRQLSGGGGTHQLYGYEGELHVPSGHVDGYPGIDVKADGGMIVVAPSMHPDSGRRYVFEDEHQPGKVVLAQAPAKLLDLLCGGTSTERPADELFEPMIGDARKAGWVPKSRPSWSAEHGWTWQITRPGKEPREGTAASVHPWPDPHVIVFSTSVRGATTFHPYDPQSWGELVRGGDVGQADEDDDGGFHAVDLGPYLRGTVVRVMPDLAVMSDGRALLYRARLNGIHGDSGTGKSWLVEFVVRELIDAGLVVMVIDLEDTPDPLIERLRQIGVSDETIEHQVVFVRPHDAFTWLNVERLIEMVTEYRVAHVLLETLGEALNAEGLNEDRDNEVGPWLHRVCRHLIETTTVGMTLIDHGTKSAEKPLEPSGTKRKKATSTGTWWLMKVIAPFTRENGGKVEIICAKDRHGWYRKGDTVAHLVMGALDPITGRSELRLEPAPATSAPALEDQVVAVVDKAVMRMSLRAVVAAVRAVCPASNESIRTAVDLAAGKGRIQESAGPNRARMFSSASVPGPTPSGTPEAHLAAHPDDEQEE